MDIIVKCADDTGFHKKTGIASRQRLDIWIKGAKIEQVRKHKILGLIFDTRMNWNEYILS
jgi:hypothetical protein